MGTQQNMSYICRFHSREELENWVNSLKYFYFVRGVGGHTIDGDKFVVEFEYSSIEEVRMIFQTFSVLFHDGQNGPPFNSSEISNGDKMEQIEEYPGFHYRYIEKNQDIGKYVKFRKGKCTVEIFNSGSDFHTVFENHFQECLSLESSMRMTSLKVLRTIEGSDYCISARSFPEFFHD